jgi:hypothetical protein
MIMCVALLCQQVLEHQRQLLEQQQQVLRQVLHKQQSSQSQPAQQQAAPQPASEGNGVLFQDAAYAGVKVAKSGIFC